MADQLSAGRGGLADELARRLGALPGVVVAPGRFRPEPAWWAGRTEIAHLDADDLLDVRLTKAVIRARRAELRADPRVELRPSTSDWLSVRIGSTADVDFAVALVAEAAAAHGHSG